ncbi:putative glutaminase [Aureobasidium pullulans]|uniref:Putative glutaminase n=1 Tax=Aureobasidium pullulans TaxID=5580 RepID=A0A4T0BT46_AURPU|nr:putative glutaminase [Aureobasidium pullulans]
MAKMKLHHVAVAVTSLVSSVAASTLTPPVLPLVVRNPYLSTWLGNARDKPWTKWPMFYTGEEIGFSVLASVPETSTAYPLLGRPQDSLDDKDTTLVISYNISYPVYQGAQYDASVMNLTYRIPSHDSKSEHVEVVLSFLSPVTPSSTLRQSIPASYLSIHVTGSFDIDIYVDLNGQWVSGDRGSEIVWELENAETEKLKSWVVKRKDELVFAEWNDRAEWGSLRFTGPSDVRHESGTSGVLRNRFSRTGTLQNENDERFRSIMQDEPVFAFSKSFNLAPNTSSHKNTSSDSVLFTIAHIQDPVTQYASARGLTFMRPLWKTWFPTDDNLTSFHYMDFNNAQKLAQNYSDQLAIDAYQSGSDSYVDIVALSARQTMGATSFSGTQENPLLFLKEISSNGNSQTVDVIFPAFPFFLYTQPRWLAYLLEPLIEHMLSGQYPNDYSMHDLGTHFPNLTGHADGKDEYMPVEECGDMLIMGLALVNSLTYGSGPEAQSVWSALGSDHIPQPNEESPFALGTLENRDHIVGLDDRWGGSAQGLKQARKWLDKSYGLWKQWTSYLVEYSLEPHNQLSTDDFAGWLALQTNLALKGIVGIRAMSELATVMDKKDDAKHFRNISDTYIKRWEELGISRDGTHAKLAYDWYGSWTTLYSLYADALLCFHPSTTNGSSAQSSDDYAQVSGGKQEPILEPPTHDFIPDHIYKMQSDWYAAVMQKYGLPLDSRHLYTKSDWEFQAAAVSSRKTRTEILDRVSKWLNETSTDRPFTDLYDTEGEGGFPGPNFFARPVIGSHFAFLTLERACGGTAMKGLSFLDEE